MILRYLLAAAACCTALPAAALLTRPDRDDGEYLELATHYPSCVRLAAPAAEGVLVSPRWVLSTAAAADALKARASTIEIGGRAHAVRSIHRQAGGPLALLLLEEHVRGVEPAAIYRGDAEAGAGVVIVGHGNGARRAGINTVERVAPQSFGLRVKRGAQASDLQAAVAHDERAVPAYLRTESGTFVAGLFLERDGDWENYARLSAHARWIDDTMLDVALAESRGLT